MQLRAATSADIAAIQAIYAHHVLHGLASFEIEPPSAAEMHRRFESLTGDGYPYLVATVDGSIVGYAYAGATGRQLLSRLIDECERRGYRQMLAVIGDSANAASIELHRGCGFTVSGTLRSVGLKFGRWIDSVIMQRSLGESDRTVPRA